MGDAGFDRSGDCAVRAYAGVIEMIDEEDHGFLWLRKSERTQSRSPFRTCVNKSGQ